MYNLIGKTSDNSIYCISENGGVLDKFSENEVKLLLHMGIPVEGVELDAEGNLKIAESVPVLDTATGRIYDPEYEIDEDEEWDEEEEEEFDEEADTTLEAQDLYDNLSDDILVALGKKQLGMELTVEDKAAISELSLEQIDLLFDNFDFTDEVEEEEDEEDDYETEEEDSDDDDDEIDEEDEEDKENEVSLLYKLLPPEHKQILQMYYIWYARHIFENAEKKDTQAVTNALKKAKMDKIKKYKAVQDAQWVYGGFIDFGCVVNNQPDMQDAFDDEKAIYRCSLGHHNLRYMHIIWDANYGDLDEMFFGEMAGDEDYEFTKISESEHAIKVGETCLADFFEVANVDLVKKELRAIQRTAVKDMAQLYKIYVNEDKQKVLDSLSVLTQISIPFRRLLITHMIGGNHDPYFKKCNLAPFSHLEKMTRAGMIPPQSLVQMVRDILAGWYIDNETNRIDFRLHTYNQSMFAYSFKPLTTGKALEEWCKDLNRVKAVPEGYIEPAKVTAWVEQQLDNGLRRKYKDKVYYNVSGYMWNVRRLQEVLFKYISYFMSFKICGFYENNCIEVYENDLLNKREGKTGEDKNKLPYEFISEGGGRGVGVKVYEFYKQYKKLIDVYDYSIDSLKKACHLVSELMRIQDEIANEELGYLVKYRVGVDSENNKYKIIKEKVDLSYIGSRDLPDEFSEYNFAIQQLFSNYSNIGKEKDENGNLINVLDSIQKYIDIFDRDKQKYAEQALELIKEQIHEQEKKDEEEKLLREATDKLCKLVEEYFSIVMGIPELHSYYYNRTNTVRIYDNREHEVNAIVLDLSSLDEVNAKITEYTNFINAEIQKNYKLLFEYLDRYAKLHEIQYYDTVEDSYEVDDGILFIEYSDEAHTDEKEHTLFDVKLTQKYLKEEDNMIRQVEAHNKVEKAKADAEEIIKRMEVAGKYADSLLDDKFVEEVSEDDVLSYIKNYDLDSITDPAHEREVTIANAWLNSNYDKPTSNMYYHIKNLYNFLNNTGNASDKVDISVIPRLNEALTYFIDKHKDIKADSRDVSICKSIFSSGKMSKRQSKYAVRAFSEFVAENDIDVNSL